MLGSRQPAQAYRLSVGPIVKHKPLGYLKTWRPLENYRNGLHLLGTSLGVVCISWGRIRKGR